MNDEPPSTARSAKATVNRDADGDPLGATLFLGVDDLERLGIETARTREIAYWIEDGTLHVAPKTEVVLHE